MPINLRLGTSRHIYKPVYYHKAQSLFSVVKGTYWNKLFPLFLNEVIFLHVDLHSFKMTQSLGALLINSTLNKNPKFIFFVP